MYKNSYEFDLDEVQMVDCLSQWWWRLFQEARHSMPDQNSINEHIQIPDMNTILANT